MLPKVKCMTSRSWILILCLDICPALVLNVYHPVIFRMVDHQDLSLMFTPAEPLHSLDQWCWIRVGAGPCRLVDLQVQYSGFRLSQ